ncbi:MAG: hypothetical protein WA871_13895 [Candidatus Acidiferrales bacterium]
MTTSAKVPVSRRTAASAHSRGIFLCVLMACCALALAAQSPPVPNTIGTIEGDDLLVQAAPNEAMVVKQGVTPLDSGAAITVRTGQALIELGGGGEIGVCGPAHFSVVQSGATLTLALDYGRVHPQLPPSTSVVIYTPLITATPIAIGEQQRDLTVALESSGAMCVTSTQGAVRVAQQLSDESVIVPEGGAINLADGALAPAAPAGSCLCFVRLARYAPPAPPIQQSPAIESSESNQPRPPARMSAPLPPVDAPPPAAPAIAPVVPADNDQAIYQVYMPPLTFNPSAASSSTQPSPQTILIVRHARVEPGALFVGVVEAAAPPARNSSAPSASAPRQQKSSGAAPAAARPGVYQRMRSYIRNLFGGS